MTHSTSHDLKTLDNFLDSLDLDNRRSDAPIVVVGPGRSGTSAVAKRLHDAGVFMGEQFRQPNQFNPEGYFEDLEMVHINDMVERGVCAIPTWETNFKHITDTRREQHRLWGWKDPRTAAVVQHVARLFPKATFVRTRRNRNAILESLRRCYGFNQRQAEAMVNRREGNLDRHCPKDRTVEVQIGDKPSLDVVDNVPRVRIAIPTSGRIHQDVVNILLGLTSDPRYHKEFQVSNAKPYESNLNSIAANVKVSQCDFLLTMDDDNPPARNPLDLVELDKDIIGFPTPMLLGNAPIWNVFESKGNGHFTPCAWPNGLHKVGAVGSGCLLIARRVLDHPDMKHPFSTRYDEEGIRDGGADLQFCERATKAGFEVWAHFDYTCSHYKELDLRALCR